MLEGEEEEINYEPFNEEEDDNDFKDANQSKFASGLITFLLRSTEDLCDRLKSKLQQKQGKNDTNRFHDEKVVTIEKQLEYKCVLPNFNTNKF